MGTEIVLHAEQTTDIPTKLIVKYDATFRGNARSNFFRVEDEAEFLEWASGFQGLVVIRDDQGRVGLRCEEDHGHWFVLEYNRHEVAYEELSAYEIVSQISTFLQDGSVAVFMDVNGAIAVNSQDEVKQLWLPDIYDLAESLGDEVQKIEWANRHTYMLATTQAPVEAAKPEQPAPVEAAKPEQSGEASERSTEPND
jgi:hypothetical protein